MSHTGSNGSEVSKAGARGIWQTGIEGDVSGWDEPAFPERRPTARPEELELDLRNWARETPPPRTRVIPLAAAVTGTLWAVYVYYNYTTHPAFGVAGQSGSLLTILFLPLILIALVALLAHNIATARRRRSEWDNFPADAQRIAQESASAPLLA